MTQRHKPSRDEVQKFGDNVRKNRRPLCRRAARLTSHALGANDTGAASFQHPRDLRRREGIGFAVDYTLRRKLFANAL